MRTLLIFTLLLLTSSPLFSQYEQLKRSFQDPAELEQELKELNLSHLAEDASFAFTTKQQNDVTKIALDSLVEETYNNITSTWERDEINLYTYNYHSKVSEFVRQLWAPTSSTYNTRFRSVTNFDASGTRIGNESFVWDAALMALTPNFKVAYTHNSDGLVNTYSSELWSTTLATYENYSRNEYEYIEDLLWKITQYTWDDVLNIWEASIRTTYTYGANELITLIIRESYSPTLLDWENESRTIRTYNSAGLLDYDEDSDWDDFTLSWELDRKRELQYNSSNQLEETIESEWDWVTTDWALNEKSNYEYNGTGNRIRYEYANWDDVAFEWIPRRRYTTTYNSEFNDIAVGGEEWDPALNVWVYDGRRTREFTNYLYAQSILPGSNQSSYDIYNNAIHLPSIHVNYDNVDQSLPESRGIYHYSEKVVSTIKGQDLIDIAIYPNPANNQITVEVENIENPSIKLYNTVGQKVIEKPLLNTSLDISSLQQGMYFYIILENGNILSKGKLQKQ